MVVNMPRLHYRRLEYTQMDKVSAIVFRELGKLGIEKTDIDSLAWYKFGQYAKQPLIAFLKDGRIFKVGTRKGNLYVERIK